MLAHSAALAVAYWLIAMAAAALFPFAGGVAVMWPSTGIALAALVAWGPRVVLGVVAGAIAAGFSAGLDAGATLLSAALVTGECLLGWWLLESVARFDRSLAHLRGVRALL